MLGTFPPPPRVSDPDMHHGTCLTHVPWCMPGSLTSGFLWSRWRGKAFPAFPAHAQPAIVRIWQEAHGDTCWKTRCVLFLASKWLNLYQKTRLCYLPFSRCVNVFSLVQRLFVCWIYNKLNDEISTKTHSCFLPFSGFVNVFSLVQRLFIC